MADANYNSMHQYEQPKVPSVGSQTEMKRFVAQLIEIFDDIYRRYGRLRLEDMNKSFRQRFEDAEGNYLEISKSVEGLVLAVNNNRVKFDANGITIINADGTTVFTQDNTTGDVTITGYLEALGGKLGGFTIDKDGLTNGALIQLLSTGNIVLGGLRLVGGNHPGIMYLDAAGNIVWNAAEGAFTINQVFYATGPIYLLGQKVVIPNLPTTTNPANLYVSPSTGQLFRSTSTGGGTDPDPGGDQPRVSISVSPSSITLRGVFSISFSLTNVPDGYARIEIVGNNGMHDTITDPQGGHAEYVPDAVGNYWFNLYYYDTGGTEVAYASAGPVTVNPF